MVVLGELRTIAAVLEIDNDTENDLVNNDRRQLTEDNTTCRTTTSHYWTTIEHYYTVNDCSTHPQSLRHWIKTNSKDHACTTCLAVSGMKFRKPLKTETSRKYVKKIYPNVTTFMHPNQRVEAFGNISSPLCTLAIL